jgi:hypothetical protein
MPVVSKAQLDLQELQVLMVLLVQQVPTALQDLQVNVDQLVSKDLLEMVE